MSPYKVPIINIEKLVHYEEDISVVARSIKNACSQFGFFYIINHGVPEHLQDELELLTEQFFSLPQETKNLISMSSGGRAWRGYFAIGEEFTSGKPDQKEGLYFGVELGENHPKVQAKVPLHGANLFPQQLPRFSEVVLKYIDRLTALGKSLMRGIAVSLDLPHMYFNTYYTNDPLTLFRIFHYPSTNAQSQTEAEWGVGEHTDYGLLTILKQDKIGGLQIKCNSGWIDAPYIKGTFICNIGDMLDKMTMGMYRSTPHRVINSSGKSRYSWPFFFDPNWDAIIQPLPVPSDSNQIDSEDRWDGTQLSDFNGTYGKYILGKVAKVFPDLMQSK